jgi:hypothetical protein
MSRPKPTPKPTEPEMTMETPTAAPGEAVAASAPVTVGDPPADAVPVAPEKVQTYEVRTFCRFATNGLVYQLAAGSVVSSMTHDIEELRRQNVVLQLMEGSSC